MAGVSANFADRLIAEVKRKQTPLIVGIDPRAEQLPQALKEALGPDNLVGPGRSWEVLAIAFERFSRQIIDVVAPWVPAIKPQLAFFEELGPAGMVALANVIHYAQDQGLLVILDGKRNDIGTTGAAYAAAYLGRRPRSAWGGDALTINPWMGFDTLEPFVSQATRTDAGLFVLVKTSNPGSGDLQEQKSDGRLLYEQVADRVETASLATQGANGYGIVGAVVGATYPEQLASLRKRMPHTLFLVPGFGAQGGSAQDVAGALDANGLGAVINSSRGIIFAYETKEFRPSHPSEWQRSVERATWDARDRLAADTSAGQLRSRSGS